MFTVLVPGDSAQGPPKPLSKDRVVEYLKGEVSPARVTELVRQRGVDFETTPEIEKELRSAGATDALLSVLRDFAPKRSALKEEPAPSTLLIESVTGSAQVFIDEELIARASPDGRLKIRLTPGQHRVRLSLEGYRDTEQNVQMLAGVPQDTVKLTPVAALEAPNPGPPSAAGRALAAKVVAALGGYAKLQSVKSEHRVDVTSDEIGQPTIMEITIAFPDRVRVDLTRPEGKAAIVVSPDAAFMSAGMGTQALSLAEKNAWLDHLHRSFTYIGPHLEDPSITFTAGGTEKIGDVQAAVLEIDGAVPPVRWYVDPQSSRVLRENFKTVRESGTFDTDVKLSDWRTVDGVALPFAIKSKTNRQTTTSECKQIQIYPEIDAKIFEKPANKAKKAKKAVAPSR